MDELHRTTLSIDSQTDPFVCLHCCQHSHWVSHGFVYKKQTGGTKIAVGKRLFCSNRSRRGGCGRTLRLSLATVLPRLHYSALSMSAFLLAWLHGTSIKQAYLDVTGVSDARNAARWLNALQLRLVDFRACLRCRPPPSNPPPNRSAHGSVLGATLNSLFSRFGLTLCQSFQFESQLSFV